MNIKKILPFIGILIILLALFVGSVYLRDKQENSEQTNNQTSVQNGTYSIENKEFGYRFKISDKYFGINNSDYKIIRNGYTTSYYVKTSDPEWIKEGKIYTEVLAIGAVTKKEAESKKALCDQNNIQLQETPFDCLAFTNPLGENKYLYFFKYPHIVEYPKDLSDIKIDEAITESMKQMEFFDPEVEPKTLTYDSYMEGFSFDYPAYTDHAFWDPAKNDELGALMSLPNELGGMNNNISEKVLLHTLSIEYCALSGKCRPTTTNFAINVGYTGKTMKQLRDSALGNTFQRKNIRGKDVYQYQIGAEGEGIIYYFLEGRNDKAFVVALRYLNEQVLSKYITAKGFISLDKQKNTAEEIIDSLNFQAPLNQN